GSARESKSHSVSIAIQKIATTVRNVANTRVEGAVISASGVRSRTMTLANYFVRNVPLDTSVRVSTMTTMTMKRTRKKFLGETRQMSETRKMCPRSKPKTRKMCPRSKPKTRKKAKTLGSRSSAQRPAMGKKCRLRFACRLTTDGWM